MNVYTIFMKYGLKYIIEGRDYQNALLNHKDEHVVKEIDFSRDGDVRDRYDWDISCQKWRLAQ